MKWFKHDSNALHDAKIEKLIMRHGIEGYGLYFACIEIIASELTSENITFELEHDAEILAYKFKIDTLKVEEIMKYCIDLGLFQYNIESQRIVCYKLAYRLDKTMSQNIGIQQIVTSKNFQKLPKTSSSQKQIRLDKNRLEENKEDKKHKYGEYSHVLLTDTEYQKIQEKTGDVKKWIKTLDEGIELKKYKYNSHYLAILKWYSKDNVTTAGPPKLKSTLTPLDTLTSEEQEEVRLEATRLREKYVGEQENK